MRVGSSFGRQAGRASTGFSGQRGEGGVTLRSSRTTLSSSVNKRLFDASSMTLGGTGWARGEGHH